MISLMPGKKKPGENRSTRGELWLRVPPGCGFRGENVSCDFLGVKDARGNRNNLSLFRPLLNTVNACADSRRDARESPPLVFMPHNAYLSGHERPSREVTGVLVPPSSR